MPSADIPLPSPPYGGVGWNGESGMNMNVIDCNVLYFKDNWVCSTRWPGRVCLRRTPTALGSDSDGRGLWRTASTDGSGGILSVAKGIFPESFAETPLCGWHRNRPSNCDESLRLVSSLKYERKKAAFRLPARSVTQNGAADKGVVARIVQQPLLPSHRDLNPDLAYAYSTRLATMLVRLRFIRLP